MESYALLLQHAMEGDINAFQTMFATFQPALKSYLFRLTAHRADAEDLAHDTFIRAFDKLHTFQQNAQLKTWVFQIATRLAYDQLREKQRWSSDVLDQAKALVLNNPKLGQQLEQVATHSPYGIYEVKEHISTCFTCISKNLPLLQQVILLLKDVYAFSVQEIMLIVTKTEGQVKYALQSARSALSRIFDQRCALVNKNGTCHQCSELNGWLNPKQQEQEATIKHELKADSSAQLYQLRAALVAGIDPLTCSGHALQEALLDCSRLVMES